MISDADNLRLEQILEQKLAALGIRGEVAGIRRGPSVTTLLFRPSPSTRACLVAKAVEDLSLVFGRRVRVLTPMEGMPYVGVEITNPQREIVLLETVLWEMHGRQYSSPLTFPVGLDTFGNLVTADLRELPHLLVAGTTGSGKSNFLHTLVLSLMCRNTYDKVHFVLIDTKAVEFTPYNREGHLIDSVVVTDPEGAIDILRRVLAEVELRYQRMAAESVRHACQLGLPDIVVVVDELADLMAVRRREVANLIQRIAQKARAAGIHLVLATQRPSVETLPGIIKANFPARLAFRLPSIHDSKTILDIAGAEHLLGLGDGLLIAPGLPLTRIQAPFVSDQVMEAILKPMRYPSSRWRRWVAAWRTRFPNSSRRNDAA